MSNSTHRCEVVEVHPQVHPNADKLEVVNVFGYSVCVRKGEFQDGQLGVYIPPDSIVPERPEFAFIWEMKGYAPAPGEIAPDAGHGLIPEKFRRVKAKKLRGVISEGLLMPLKTWEADLGYGLLSFIPGDRPLQIGADVAQTLGITHYNPPDPSSTGGDSESAPAKKRKRGYPKTIRGWFRFLLSKIGIGRHKVEQTEEIGLEIPKYDLDAWQRYKGLLKEGELIWITEKIHGANARYVFFDNRMYVGSHFQWKKDTPGSAYWQALRQNPWIEAFCKQFPNHVLYGELVPTQNLAYGQEKGQYKLYGFDVFNLYNRTWLSHSELLELDFYFPYLTGDDQFVEEHLLDHWVPTVALTTYEPELIRKWAEGLSLVDHANHIREGIVIKPIKERFEPHFGRVILKLKSVEFLEKN